jgi:hypothetical protein
MQTRSGVSRIIIILLVLAASASASYLPLAHRAYRDIEILRVRGFVVVQATTTKPFTRDEIARGLRLLAVRAGEMSPYTLQIYRRLTNEFARDAHQEMQWWVRTDVNPRVISQTNPMRIDQPRVFRVPATELVPGDRVRSINTLDAAVQVTPNVSVAYRMEIDTDGLADNNLNAGQKTYRFGSTGYVDQAYVMWENDRFALAFGRMPMVWGPGREGNLAMSENAPNLDMLLGRVYYKWFTFTGFTGQLISQRIEDGAIANRYLAGHRLVVTPWKWIEIGVSETVIYAGPDRGLSLRWSNPMLPYLAEEVNSRDIYDNNLYASGDITVRPIPGVESYVEFLIDDIALDGKSPHRIGWTFGSRWESPFGFDRMGLGAEYTRITRWVYNYALSEQRFANNGSILGHFLGPDGDMLAVRADWETPGAWLVRLAVSHRRRGETRFTSKFPVDISGENFGYSSDPFPYGTVETTTTADVIVQTPRYCGASLLAAGIFRTVKNANNVATGRTWDAGFRLELDWHLTLVR